MSDSTFGVQLLPTFSESVRTWWGSVLPLTVGALVTLSAYGVFRYPANELYQDDRVFASIGVDLIGLIVAGTLAMPWYRHALAAVDGDSIGLTEPLGYPRRFGYQAVASFWFWAAVLLGLRYLFGIPSLFIAIVYAFHGYVIADGKAKGGMLALGTSVRLTEKRRIGLFAVGGLLMIFNFIGLFGLGIEAFPTPVRYVLAVVGLSITTSISLVFGAKLYRVFEKDLK